MEKEIEEIENEAKSSNESHKEKQEQLDKEIKK